MRKTKREPSSTDPVPGVRRIGIFGGTFNPIHNCHLQIARITQKRMNLEQVIFVPSGQPPHKPEEGIQTPQDRLEMVRLAIAGQPRFGLSDEEVSRPGKSYAFETVNSFRRRYPGAQLFFILGVDAFLEIGSWKNSERLMEQCHFVVVSRHGFPFELLEKVTLPFPLEEETLLSLDQGRASKRVVLMKAGMDLFLLKIPPCRISSTEVRRGLRARRNGKKQLPEAVKSYILKNGLYRGVDLPEGEACPPSGLGK